MWFRPLSITAVLLLSVYLCQAANENREDEDTTAYKETEKNEDEAGFIINDSETDTEIRENDSEVLQKANLRDTEKPIVKINKENVSEVNAENQTVKNEITPNIKPITSKDLANVSEINADNATVNNHTDFRNKPDVKIINTKDINNDKNNLNVSETKTEKSEDVKSATASGTILDVNTIAPENKNEDKENSDGRNVYKNSTNQTSLPETTPLTESIKEAAPNFVTSSPLDVTTVNESKSISETTPLAVTSASPLFDDETAKASVDLKYLYFLLLLIPIAGVIIGLSFYFKRRKRKEHNEPTTRSNKSRRFSTPSWVFSEPEFDDEEIITLQEEKK